MNKKELKICFLLIVFFCNKIAVFGQQFINNDGSYVMTLSNKNELIICSTSTAWKYTVLGISNPQFISDNKRVLFKRNDTLFLLTLGTIYQTLITNVKSFRQPEIINQKWMAYQPKENAGRVVLRDLITNRERSFDNALDYSFDKAGNIFLLTTEINNNSNKEKNISYLSLKEVKSIDQINIVSFFQLANVDIVKCKIDTHVCQFVFLIKEKLKPKNNKSIWYYKVGMKEAVVLANDSLIGIDKNLEVSTNFLEFSKKGTKVFFNLTEKYLPKVNPAFVKVDVWSYTDATLQSQQLIHNNELKLYPAVISLPDKNIIRLQYDNENIFGGGQLNGYNSLINEAEDYAIVCSFNGDVLTNGILPAYLVREFNWNNAVKPSVYIVSMKSGKRELVKKGIQVTSARLYFRISPENKYILYYDGEQKNYYTYEIASRISRNISKNSKTSWEVEDPSQAAGQFHAPLGIINWSGNDKKVYLIDHFGDIWQVDPLANDEAKCITNRYFKKHPWIKWLYFGNNENSFKNSDKIILTARNKKSMDMGYYVKELSKTGDPELLTMGAYKYGNVQKDVNNDLYILSRESISESPQMFYTKNFKVFNPVESYQPSHINGINAEIVRWKTFDGSESMGTLFKPIGFDSSKKYPIVFYYYEETPPWRDWNQFDPAKSPINYPGSGGDIDIRYYVNHGYLIFTPGILNYQLGNPGRSAYNAVVSAAEYLSKKYYVDSKRMGIEGISFGAFQTNYIVSHTNLFAAACSASGVTDLVSYYGESENDEVGYSQSSAAVNGQNRIGTTPWERPDLYLKNSAIFYADRINTPLLILGNKKDNRYPSYSNGVELFKGLRRMNKRVWLLQYDDGDHNVGENGSGTDFAIRMLQFFDHYLKGLPAPIWMTQGIPARLKGTTLGLEYDTTMKTPGPGLLMENEGALTPQQKELLKHRTTVNNEGRIVDVPSSVRGKKK